MKKAKVENPSFKTKAEEMCKGVSPAIMAQAVTLAQSVLTLQEKIEQQTPIYKEQDLCQEVTLQHGETVLRANPIVQEFRATVKDYSAALKSLKDILEEHKTEEEVSPVDSLRNKFKVG